MICKAYLQILVHTVRTLENLHKDAHIHTLHIVPNHLNLRVKAKFHPVLNPTLKKPHSMKSKFLLVVIFASYFLNEVLLIFILSMFHFIHPFTCLGGGRGQIVQSIDYFLLIAPRQFKDQVDFFSTYLRLKFGTFSKIQVYSEPVFMTLRFSTFLYVKIKGLGGKNMFFGNLKNHIAAI